MQRRRICFFTLTELITAMAVLIVLMYALINFFFSIQSVWVDSAKKSAIYENANLVFSMIEQDLKGIVISCPFYYDSSTNAVNFVTSSAISSDNSYKWPYFEVRYMLGLNGAFKRLCVSDKGTTTPNDYWDFYRADRQVASAQKWFETPASNTNTFRNLVFGITDLTFTRLKRGGTVAAADEIPAYLSVTLNMLTEDDYKVYDVLASGTPKDTFKNMHARKFTKTFCLRNLL